MASSASGAVLMSATFIAGPARPELPGRRGWSVGDGAAAGKGELCKGTAGSSETARPHRAGSRMFSGPPTVRKLSQIKNCWPDQSQPLRGSCTGPMSCAVARSGRVGMRGRREVKWTTLEIRHTF